MSDDLVLTVAGSAYGGWTDISVTRRAEGLPNSFAIGVTARDPSSGITTVAAPGDTCQVALGGDLVVTGYIDRVSHAGSARAHTLMLVGRGKCADLVDCSAEFPGAQIKGASVLEVAKKLAQPYGIDVAMAADADPGPAVPQLNLNYGEKAFAVIDRLTRAAGLLAYEDASGRLLLGVAGKVVAASGCTYGDNVQDWEVVAASDERFSDVVSVRNSVNIYREAGDSFNINYTAKDPGVRHRLIYVVEEAAPDRELFGQQKVIWEQARRAGRGTRVQVTVDSWRDRGGELWQPNTLVGVDVPGLTLADRRLVVAEVTYRRDNSNGTTASLVLMPKAAFTPEPVVLQPTSFAGTTL